MDSLEIDGKEYVSARRAGREYGYTSDYIGQLVRKGLIVGKKVGRAWYIEQESLSTYTSSIGTQDAPEKVVIEPSTPVESTEEVSEVALAPVPVAVEFAEALAVPEPVPLHVMPEVQEMEEKIVTKLEPKKPYEYLSVRQPNREVEVKNVSMHDVFSMKYVSDDEPSLPHLQERKAKPVIEVVPAVQSVFIRTMSQDMKEEPLPVVHVRSHDRTRAKASSGRVLNVLGGLATAAVVLVLLLTAASTALLDKTLTFDGKEISAGVAFSFIHF